MSNFPPNPADFDKLPDSILVDDKFTASVLDISEGTLANWECSGKSDLAVVKVGNRRRRRVGDIRAYIKRNTHVPHAKKMQ